MAPPPPATCDDDLYDTKLPAPAVIILWPARGDVFCVRELMDFILPSRVRSRAHPYPPRTSEVFNPTPLSLDEAQEAISCQSPSIIWLSSHCENGVSSSLSVTRPCDIFYLYTSFAMWSGWKFSLGVAAPLISSSVAQARLRTLRKWISTTSCLRHSRRSSMI